MADQTIPSAVRQYFLAIEKKDVESWISCFEEDAISYEPGAPSPLLGHAQLRQFLVEVLGTFEAIRMSEDHVFQSGNRIAVKFTGRGTGKNGRPVFFEGIDVFEINQKGKIHTMWGYWNPAAMLAQLQ